MKSEQMPERIFACRDTVVDAWGGTVEEGWHTAPQFDEEVEYVRADIADGDPNEPVTEGQHRWASLGGERLIVFVIEVAKCCGRTEAIYRTTSGVVCFGFELDFIGPVIRPPSE